MVIIKNKKAVSPVVSTILLIAIVIVIIAIIFVWSRGFIKESIQKQGLPAEQSCSKINLDVSSCFDSEVQVTNIGNIPVYQFDIRKKSGGETDIERISEGLGIGESISIDLSTECPDRLEVVPFILGTSGNSRKAYACLNNVF